MRAGLIVRSAGPVLAIAGICAVLTGGSPFAAPSPLATCTKYAATWGSDTSPGTRRRPLKTVQHLVDSLHRGETGCLRGGNYRTSGSGLQILRSGFTLRSYPGERATLEGNTQVQPGANDVTLSKLNFVGDGRASAVKPYSSGVTISDSDITNNRLGGSCLQLGGPGFGYTTERPRIVRNRIHDCGLGGRSYPSEHGIYAGFVSGGEISGNLIYNINQGYAIQFYPSAEGVTFKHNVVDGGPTTLRGGITFAGATGAKPSSDDIVEHNIITYAAAEGIGSIWGGARGTNNIARNNCLFRNNPNIETANGGFSSRHNLSANPLFVNRAHHDYRLRARSRCLRVVGYDTARRLKSGAAVKS
jgi:hypothetical protein